MQNGIESKLPIPAECLRDRDSKGAQGTQLERVRFMLQVSLSGGQVEKVVGSIDSLRAAGMGTTTRLSRGSISRTSQRTLAA